MAYRKHRKRPPSRAGQVRKIDQLRKSKVVSIGASVFHFLLPEHHGLGTVIDIEVDGYTRPPAGPLYVVEFPQTSKTLRLKGTELYEATLSSEVA